ncbi:MAG: methyltransferase domain-containing protein, partial [Candidatus Binatia bacterium]
LSPGVIATVRRRLGGRPWSARARRVRFIRADLNFPRFRAAHYDVIWSSNTLHHVVNLERLFGCVADALRPGGLFVVHDYIGEARLQFSPHRLARINRLLAEVPAHLRRGSGPLTAPPLDQLSPFCGVRPDEIVPLAEARFDVLHRGIAGRLFPMLLLVDLSRLEGEMPPLFARILAAEADPTLQACAAYLVLRKRAA